MKKILTALMAAAAILSVTPAMASVFDTPAQVFVKTNAKAANELLEHLKKPLPKGMPVLVANLVSVSDMKTSSTLARFISDELRSQFANKGHPVTEIELHGGLYSSSANGEFLLSQDIKHAAATNDNIAVVIGTYAVSDSTVFINLKMVDPANNDILAGYSYSVDASGMDDLLKK